MAVRVELDIDALLSDCAYVLWVQPDLQNATVNKSQIVNAEVTCSLSHDCIAPVGREFLLLVKTWLDAGPGARSTFRRSQILRLQPT